jgi:signal transduction histidine kinase
VEGFGVSETDAEDVAPKVHARGESLARESWLRALGERAEHGVVLYDETGRAVCANSSARRIVGRALALRVPFDEHTLALALEESDGAPVATVSHPVTLALRGVETHDREVFISVGSTRRAFLTDASPVRDALGRIEGAILTLKDFAELERGHAFREAFLARAGHELRNPLAALVTATQVLERRAKKRGEPPDRALEIVTESVQNLHRLVEDLLDLSRIGRGKFELKLERVPLGPILLAGVEDVRRAHPGADIQILVVGDVAEGEWDPDRIRQLVRNLVVNAIVHGRPPVEVRISAQEPTRVSFRIRDHGDGVALSRREEVLKPFVRRDRNVGLGLGLAIAFEIARAHGGRLWLADPEDGKGGCAAHVELPLC